ncbi:MAG TPA: adenylate/guanylate cyclase domain-containing protein [Stellaceae bacterium]|jgi:adenylate cyclase|nr:adenylate/guanylate cyclase domain-containing protein [Stellaceae bacterium]
MTWHLALGAALLVIAILAAALFRQRRHQGRLERQLEAAAGALEGLQQACSRLAPAGVVQRLIADGMEADTSRQAERKVATAMFVDLVGFTALSEQMEPGLLVRLLNGYYRRMSDAIEEHRGQVGSFVGDGIVAYFGAIERNPWQCDDAVRAALAMRAAIRDYNAELEREGLPRIAIGIGIDRGPGFAGLVGSRERREYAFIGRAVNLAARVQALTRVHRTDILVTDALRAELDASFVLEPMPAEPVKGFAEPVITYAVRGRSEG